MHLEQYSCASISVRYHLTAICSRNCACGSVGQYSTLLQPILELPHSAQGEPLEGADSCGREGIWGGCSRVICALLRGQCCHHSRPVDTVLSNPGVPAATQKPFTRVQYLL